jgi:putative membrane protein
MEWQGSLSPAKNPKESNMFAAEFVAQSDNWDHMNGWGGGWMFLWGLAMMTAVIALVVWLVRSNTAPANQSRPDPSERAREILAERFAKGELSAEEYRERVSELS